MADDTHRMGQFLREENTVGYSCLPAGTDVLRAFTCPSDEVKVLIIGQDPCPAPGRAMEFSFSVQSGVRPVPRSLMNIFKEYSSDPGLPTPSNGGFTP